MGRGLNWEGILIGDLFSLVARIGEKTGFHCHQRGCGISVVIVVAVVVAIVVAVVVTVIVMALAMGERGLVHLETVNADTRRR